MTVGLSASGVPGLARLARRPQPLSPRWVCLAAALGAAGYVVSAVGAGLARRSPLGRESLARLGACTGSVSRPLAALLVIPASIGEEVFWRESLFGRCLGTEKSPQLGRLIRSTLVYAAIQASSLQPLPPLGGLLLGSGAGWIRTKSGSIWPPVVAHLTFAELSLVAPSLPGMRPSHPNSV